MVEGAQAQFGDAWNRALGRFAPLVAHLTAGRIALALLAVGILLRGWHLLSGRSLWLDEAMIAASIANRDWGGLLQPLEYSQVAPLGWLFVEKAAFQLLGSGEFALRLPQFVAGAILLIIAAQTARRMFGAPGFVFAAAAFALSPELVRFSAEAKPYIMDALAAVLALAFAERYFGRGARLGGQDFVALAVIGMAAVSLSFPAAFVLAALGGALFLREAGARRWLAAGGVALTSGLWLAVFVALQMATHETQGANVDVMEAEWSRSFAPFPPTRGEDLKWYVTSFFRLFEFNFGAGAAIAALLATLIGAASFARRNLLWLVVLLGPIALALIASCLKLYPFQDRLLLFAAPLLYFLAAAGVNAAAAMSRAPVLATIAAAVLLLHGALFALWGAFTYYPAPFATEHVRPVMEQVAALRQDGDPIFVDRPAAPAYRYYNEQTGLAAAPVILSRGGAEFGCLLSDLERITSHPRIWVLYTHAERVFDVSQEVVLTQFADAVGQRVRSIESISVRAHLYEFDEEGAVRMAAIRRAMALEDCSAQSGD